MKVSLLPFTLRCDKCAGISVLWVVILLALIAGLAAFAVPKVCQHNQTVVVEGLVQRYAFAFMGVEEDGKLLFDAKSPERMAQEIAAELGGDGCVYGESCRNHCPIGGVFEVKVDNTAAGDTTFSVSCSRHGQGAENFLSAKELTALLQYLKEYWTSEKGRKVARENGIEIGDTDRLNSALLYAKLAELHEGKTPEGARMSSELSSLMPKDFSAFWELLTGVFGEKKPRSVEQETRALLEHLGEGNSKESPASTQSEGTTHLDRNEVSNFIEGVTRNLLPKIKLQAVLAEADNAVSLEQEMTWKDEAPKSPYP